MGWINDIKGKTLSQNMNLANANDEFFSLYNQINFESIYGGNDYIKFFEVLVNSIYTINSIPKMFKITKNHKSDNSNFYSLIIQKANKLLEDKGNNYITTDTIEKIISTIFDEKLLKSFFDKLEKVMNINKLIKIYISILPKISDLSKGISKKIIKFLIDNMINNKNDTRFLLDIIKNNEQKLSFFF